MAINAPLPNTHNLTCERGFYGLIRGELLTEIGATLKSSSNAPTDGALRYRQKGERLGLNSLSVHDIIFV